jgi:hypothetical protein
MKLVVLLAAALTSQDVPTEAPGVTAPGQPLARAESPAVRPTRLPAESVVASQTAEPPAFCVGQGESEIGNFAPLVTDEDVATFYSYDFPADKSYNGTYAANSDDSMIFLHQDATTGALSLVVVHDKPVDGSGGQVHFDVSGLGPGATMAVEDDPGLDDVLTLDGAGNASLTWSWHECCTDGVALSGIDWDAGCVTVTPTFTAGIDTWSFVDGGTQTRTGLDTAAPLVICQGGCNGCPTASAGSPQTLECSGGGAAAVILDGSDSIDPDDDDLTFAWSIDAGAQAAEGEITTVTLGLGAHDVVLSVSDGVCEDEDTTPISVLDTTAPEITSCPANADVVLGAADCAASLAQAATAGDLCDGPVSAGHLFSFAAPGTETFTYDLGDSSGNETTCTQAVTALDQTAPVASCPADETLVLDAACSADLVSHATADDACDGTLSESHAFSFAAPGSQTHTYELADASGNTAHCAQVVAAIDATAPNAQCPPDETVALDAATCQVTAVSEATATDACDGALSEAHVFSFAGPGSQTWVYVLADSAGNTATCTQTVTAIDITPPQYTAGPDLELWAPNHKYATVTLGQCGSAWDACSGFLDLDAGGGSVLQVESSEPDDVGAGGDGATADDIVVVDGHTIALRAERQGGGDGRVYSVAMQIHDTAGNASAAACRVEIEHDQGSNE